MSRRVTGALWALWLLPAAANEGPHWLKVQTSNFEIYTTAGERSGREVARHFEQVRSFFLEAMRWGMISGPKVRIVVFRSEKEFRPYAPNEVAAAFYLGADDRDYIVMKSANIEDFPVAVHEYTHLLVKHSHSEVPVWFNEGLAEFFSNLKPNGSKIEVGNLIAAHFLLLRQAKWIDLKSILTAAHDSPLYNEKTHAGLYYAECWALMHMFYLDAEYRPRLGKLLEGIKSGTDSQELLEKAYLKPVPQVENDLRSYIRGTRFSAAIFNTKLTKDIESPETGESNRLEAGLILAEILSHTEQKAAQARELYGELQREDPKDFHIEEGLARLSWRERNVPEAIAHYGRAAEFGSTDARMYLDYGRLLRSQDKRTEAISALKRAVNIKPDYYEARMELGFLYLSDEQYAPALAELESVKRVTPEQAYSFFRALAYANYGQGRKPQAKEAAAKCRQYAKNPEQVMQVEQLEQALSYEPRPAETIAAAEPERPRLIRSRPPAERAEAEPEDPPAPKLLRRREDLPAVEGILKQVDCLGKKARMRVLAGARIVSLAVSDPSAVTIKSAGQGSVEFTCGPQKPKRVRVEYVTDSSAMPGTMGVVRSIEFLE
ncbi:MAG: hypothetical protein U0Q18_13515 [Bryobacteraceae bacterium]